MSTFDHEPERHNPTRPPTSSQHRPTPPPFAPCRAIKGVDLPSPVACSFPPLPSIDPFAPVFVVGVVDTGLALQGGHVHPWLKGHVIDPNPGDVDPLPTTPGHLGPDDGHGTLVSGLILREAPTATIWMKRGFDQVVPQGSDGIDNPDQNVADMITALVQDPEHPAKIINLSFAGVQTEHEPPAEIRAAILAAKDAGVVFVAAAGNSPLSTPIWPGYFAHDPAMGHVYAIGAVDESVRLLRTNQPPKASFSNYGDWVRGYANGVNRRGPFVWFDDITTRSTFTGWTQWSGTSFAAATVTGLIAKAAISGEHGDVSESAEFVLASGKSFEDADFASADAHWLIGADSDWPLS